MCTPYLREVHHNVNLVVRLEGDSAGTGGWDGDSVQVAFSPAASWTDGSKRTGTEILYNYGLVCRRH